MFISYHPNLPIQMFYQINPSIHTMIAKIFLDSTMFVLMKHLNLYITFTARYSGERCEENIDDCQFNDPSFVPCQNGGQCRDHNGGYQCFCPSYIGYTGTRSATLLSLNKALNCILNIKFQCSTG